jgi:hypothetical protein
VKSVFATHTALTPWHEGADAGARSLSDGH